MIYKSWRHGIFWLRNGPELWCIRAPWCKPLFSEREGHSKPRFSWCGWRYFHTYDSDWKKDWSEGLLVPVVWKSRAQFEAEYPDPNHPAERVPEDIA